MVGPYTTPILGISENDDNLLLRVDMEGIPFQNLEQLIGSRMIAELNP